MLPFNVEFLVLALWLAGLICNWWFVCKVWVWTPINALVVTLSK